MSIASDPAGDAARFFTASPQPPPTAPLIGRDAEVRALSRLLGRGSASIVNVTGSRGAGKSALVRAALERASSRFTGVAHLDVTGDRPGRPAAASAPRASCTTPARSTARSASAAAPRRSPRPRGRDSSPSTESLD